MFSRQFSLFSLPASSLLHRTYRRYRRLPRRSISLLLLLLLRKRKKTTRSSVEVSAKPTVRVLYLLHHHLHLHRRNLRWRALLRPSLLRLRVTLP